MSYDVLYRGGLHTNLQTSKVSWVKDIDEPDSAIPNDSDMLFNYSMLGYIQHIRQAAGKFHDSGYIGGSYMQWYDGGLHS